MQNWSLHINPPLTHVQSLTILDFLHRILTFYTSSTIYTKPQIKEKKIGILNTLIGVVELETHWGTTGTTTARTAVSVGYTNKAS